MIVFDSSALLAIVFNEPSADLVHDLINNADVPKYLHALNAAELLNTAARRFDMSEALETLALFEKRRFLHFRPRRIAADCGRWHLRRHLHSMRQTELRKAAASTCSTKPPQNDK